MEQVNQRQIVSHAPVICLTRQDIPKLYRRFQHAQESLDPRSRFHRGITMGKSFDLQDGP
jgi:hypothetical protein